jgi:hypothetical protein
MDGGDEPQRAQLRVRCEEGKGRSVLAVTCSGRRVGEARPSDDLVIDLAPGTHDVTLRFDNQSQTWRLGVGAGEVVTIMGRRGDGARGWSGRELVSQVTLNSIHWDFVVRHEQPDVERRGRSTAPTDSELIEPRLLGDGEVVTTEPALRRLRAVLGTLVLVWFGIQAFVLPHQRLFASYWLDVLIRFVIPIGVLVVCINPALVRPSTWRDGDAECQP